MPIKICEIVSSQDQNSTRCIPTTRSQLKGQRNPDTRICSLGITSTQIP
uniref:Uncharacterized protein n=1 Tax=Rhizophora mucronata TaxID=61149 RepID=A0A2P2PL71_RHIMU